MLCEKQRRQRTLSRSCVEPVLCTVLHIEALGLALTRLGCDATSSVYPVDLLVVALDSVELQPCDAAEAVGALACGLGCGALDVVGLALDVAIVDSIGLELEEGDLLLGELVVAGDALDSFGIAGDGVVEGEGGDVGESLDVEAGGIAGGVEECCYGTVGDGDVGGSSRSAGVVLGTATDGNVSQCEAFTDSSEGSRCLKDVSMVDMIDKRTKSKLTNWENNIRKITQSVGFPQLLKDTCWDVLSWDEIADGRGSLGGSSEDGRRRKGQDEADSRCEEHGC